MTINEMQIRLIFSKDCVPHKVEYWRQRIKEAQEEQLQEFQRLQAENFYKKTKKQGTIFFRDQNPND